MTLMRSCDWLDIQETVNFQTVLLMWNSMWRKTPHFLAKKITRNDDFSVHTEPARLMTVEQGFRWWGVSLWNQMSLELRSNSSLPRF